MIEEFIDFTKTLFPSIDPYTAESAKQAVRQFQKEGRSFTCTLPTLFEELAQGDIVDNLPFVIYKEDGTQLSYKTKGLLLSNTCDAENDPVVVFAPLLNIDTVGLDPVPLRNNQFYRLLFFPDPSLMEYVVDLSIINSYSKALIISALQENRITKLHSLDRFGWYLMITKLTVHFLRPEDETVHRLRNSGN